MSSSAKANQKKKSTNKRENSKEPYRGPHRDKDWTWLIKNGSKVEIGSWYKTKRGTIIVVEDIGKIPRRKNDQREYVHVRSHVTGNIVFLTEEQVSWFTLTEEPNTPCGTMLTTGEDESSPTNIPGKDMSKYGHIYSKYPHVIEGSIYRVQNVAPDKTPGWERKRKGKKLNIKGQVRCKIKCEKCNNERDIKVQDAFQVKLCLDCKGKKRKKDLNKFLDKQKAKS